uniref:Uncharacterized protein n=1 Tax=Vibrio sp. FF_273 TaxID=1652830 RepID=A0A0H4A4T8_9VIBR|nr:hypothetical protein [Vibrio sp. FF_273]
MNFNISHDFLTNLRKQNDFSEKESVTCITVILGIQSILSVV